MNVDKIIFFILCLYVKNNKIQWKKQINQSRISLYKPSYYLHFDQLKQSSHYYSVIWSDIILSPYGNYLNDRNIFWRECLIKSDRMSFDGLDCYFFMVRQLFYWKSKNLWDNLMLGRLRRKLYRLLLFHNFILLIIDNNLFYYFLNNSQTLIYKLLQQSKEAEIFK